MDKSLIDYLKLIPDCLAPHGLRHPLWLVLLIIIMGMMSGYWGYRQLGRFVERHRRELIARLQIPKARVPSYSVIRRVMLNLDYQELEQVFTALFRLINHNVQTQSIVISSVSTISVWFTHEKSAVNKLRRTDKIKNKI